MPYIPKYIQSSINKAKMMRKPSGEQGKYNSAWQKVSVNYRRANPLCEVCLVLGEMVDITPGDRKGCVDHMIPITRNGSMYNLGNLLALCKSCHDTKSILEKTSVARHDNPAITVIPSLPRSFSPLRPCPLLLVMLRLAAPYSASSAPSVPAMQ